MNEIECSNPTCATKTHLAVKLDNPNLEWHLNNIGWTLEQQDGDLRPLPYCPRCTW